MQHHRLVTSDQPEWYFPTLRCIVQSLPVSSLVTPFPAKPFANPSVFSNGQHGDGGEISLYHHLGLRVWSLLSTHVCLCAKLCKTLFLLPHLCYLIA